MPTIRRCCIVGCLSNSRQQSQLQFFQFPKPENPFHKLWKHACHASLSRILPFKKPVVCALHFHPQCIGGRRLTSSAVPSLRLEVPSNLKDMEQRAMVEEIERSRKCAYINAVVYEWLVRANLNPQLRGSITHGMIKEKADTAKQLIGSTTFVADNRWLNRFRETHLRGFAQKLATSQLKPLGPSLWIPDIVQELLHLFPPTGHIANFESVPEQYINYMQQYGEYEEDDEPEQKEQPYASHYQQQQQQQQQHQHHHQHHQQQQQQFNHTGYDPYSHHQQPAPSYNYDDFNYYERHSSQQSNQPTPSPHPSQRSSPHSLSSPPLQQSPAHRGSPFQEPLSVKRLKLQDEEETLTAADKTAVQAEPIIEDLTGEPEEKHNPNTNGNGSNSDSSSHNSNANAQDMDERDSDDNNSDTNNHTSSKANANSPAPSFNGQDDVASSSKQINGQTNGNSSSPSPLPTITELDTYKQALEYLRPLEDFVLFKENFRAIGLISQLEMVLRKGDTIIGTEIVE